MSRNLTVLRAAGSVSSFERVTNVIAATLLSWGDRAPDKMSKVIGWLRSSSRRAQRRCHGMAGAGVLRIEQVLDRIVDLASRLGRNCCIWKS